MEITVVALLVSAIALSLVVWFASQRTRAGSVLRANAKRERAEQASREQQETLRLIVDTALDAVVTMDSAGLITGWNLQAENTFGWPRDEAIGRPLKEMIIPPRYREAHERGMQRFLATGEGVVLGKRIELVALRRDGREFPVELAINPLRLSSGLSFSAFIRDITERKQSEQALRESQQTLRSVVDNSPAVIYMKALDGKYLLVNKRFTELFGATSEEVIGHTDYERFSKSDADKFRAMDQRVAAAGCALTEEESVPLADGVHVYISVKTPLYDPLGKIYAILGISTDITDYKRADEARRQSEERFRALATASADVVYQMSPDWTEMRHLRGRDFIPDTDSPSGNWLNRYIHPKDQELVLKTINEAIANKSMFALEHQVLRVDGTLGWTSSRAVPLMDTEGNITEWFGSASDITERKEAEGVLRESGSRFRQIAESLPQLIWTCEPDGYCDYLSRQWVEFTGIPEEKQRGSGWLNQIHEADRERLMTSWTAALSVGSPFQVEFRIRRHDDVYRWFDTRAAPLKNSAGNITKWFGSNTDITEHKETEQKLRSQLAQLNLLSRTTQAIGERQDLRSIFQVVIRSLEDHLPIDFGCICLYDPGKDFLTVTCVGAKSQALALELAMTDQAHITIDQNGLSRCVRGQLVYEPDVSTSKFPFPQRLARGGLRALVIAPLLVESNVFGVLIAARRASNSFSSSDCEFLRQMSEHMALASHQTQLHGALQGAYDELRQTQQAVMQQERLRALGQMASGIAHDINNALSPVALYAESLREREPHLSERGRRYLDTISQAVEDVAATVARLREFYRQREPQMKLQPLYLTRIVPQVVDLTHARWSDMPLQRGIVIDMKTEIPAEVSPVMGVESEIREALTNLIFNAVDAMPEGGVLTLRIKPETSADGAPQNVIVEISDTGVGMNEETRLRCLEPFFTTKGERGTGLGLAMVYGVVQRHGADINIESAPAEGTTVRLSFPVATASPSAGTSPQRRLSVRLYILVVDDDPILLKSLCDTLEEDGHRVVSANGGQEGIDAFRSAIARNEPFSLVATDMGMPYVDGRKVAATVKELSPSTPVLMITGWGQRLVSEGSVPAEVDRVLSKPPKLNELREALAQLCQ